MNERIVKRFNSITKKFDVIEFSELKDGDFFLLSDQETFGYLAKADAYKNAEGVFGIHCEAYNRTEMPEFVNEIQDK